MKYTADDLNELKDFALKMKDKGVKGKIFVNQGNYNLEEPILSDENTAGRQPLQIFRIVIQTDEEAIYYEYLFNEATDLEEINVQLEEVYMHFEKEIVSVEYMNNLVR
ncbi:hypothetical protein [Sporosarcina sp. Marseille-Q4943]|uniref:hypothetical protein n=1 Tax=Sporosarcina sp. Marseille-Q4943 TaxID=2942204 RepID=UPI00208DCE32|nr:hypothetical protein [Sporosarcina sp. Marseille-Q4943]